MTDTNERSAPRKVAVITGASTGIGYQIAIQFAQHGYDLIVVANEDVIEKSAEALRDYGGTVDAHNIDLAKRAGVESFYKAILAVKRPIDALVLNAGTVVYGDFIRHNDLEKELDLIGLNVTSVIHLAKLVIPSMIERGEGRVLITSSVAALMPGPLYATYAASKAFLLSFAEAIRNELQDSGVTITALMPGATDTEIFSRAGMEHTVVGEQKKDDSADVARDAFKAMMNGDDSVIAHSLLTKIEGIGAKFLPRKLLAVMHRQMTKPSGH